MQTIGYEPGEQLIAPAVFQQDDTETNVSEYICATEVAAADAEGPGEDSNCLDRERRLVELADAEK